MKKRTLSILFVLILAFSLLTGCKSSTYTVTAISRVANEGSIDALKFNQTVEISVEENSIIGEIPITYFYDRYRFCGWYTDASFTYQWNLSTDLVVGDMTLYAKWEEIDK